MANLSAVVHVSGAESVVTGINRRFQLGAGRNGFVEHSEYANADVADVRPQSPIVVLTARYNGQFVRLV